ncbi:VOC family protein [Sphingosinicella sp. BN140058]|uniref:VOC family protein n=1 Tax=Sphingosinicella sp. BN140058 TaxID=1892855 RepID=UPI00101256C6|nr:VOC family protein [Sphingosinicella sp. BN140058]QAY79278.1 VOC family protein [Sphingosinicella sp. BN140058]
MLDHVGFAVSDLARSRHFYEAALAPLGITLIMEVGPSETESRGTALGFGVEDNPFFWIGDNERVGEGTHVAFRAVTRAEVDAFHAAALAAGGRDNGAPGLRPHYGPTYYAAFVHDPDGINVEAVCHREE